MNWLVTSYRSGKVISVFLGVLLLLLSSCNDFQDNVNVFLFGSATPTLTLTILSTLTETPSETNIPTATSTMTPRPTPTSMIACASRENGEELGLVIKVIDGVTLIVQVNGQNQTIHYLGISKPDPKSILASEALNLNSDLTLNQVVSLVNDPLAQDKDARYVLLGDKLINCEMVRNGYMVPDPQQSNLSCANLFVMAMHLAQQDRIGLWMPTPTLPPSAVQTAIAKNIAKAQQQSHAYNGGTIDFTDGKCTREAITFVTIRGKVVNHTSYTLLSLRVRGTIYDSNGQQVNTSAWFIDSDRLDPGQSSTYEVLISDPNLQFKSCSIGVEDYLLP
jgi:endonuclease YncB( thermonuclease family)